MASKSKTRPAGQSKTTTGSASADAVPPVEVIRNEKGHFRFEHAIQNGERFRDEMGQECVVVGLGIAGMPEVQYADGSTNYAFPNMLTRVADDGCGYCGKSESACTCEDPRAYGWTP